jgi:hypothetical protein
MSSARAVRYRRLALTAHDMSNAELLLKLADECDQGLLWASAARLSRKNGLPPKAEEARVLFESDSFNCRR